MAIPLRGFIRRHSSVGRYFIYSLALERFPIRWNHLIEKESLKFNELEHVLIEKVGQLFRNRL
ncbi:hypothetical protein CU048_13300 [Beijerinckiaceae bacterium]|nr:hypothetical protein CU048_13300 [Beijerinckiaceae bacterium]